MINKMLPKGFKFESYDAVKRQNEQAKLAAKQPLPKRRKVTVSIAKDGIGHRGQGAKDGTEGVPAFL